jgi:hypothetical protein
MASDGESAAFLELSRVLTGEPVLNPATAARHLKSLKKALGALAVRQLLERFVKLRRSPGDLVGKVREELFGDAVLGPVVRQVTLLWFTGLVASGGGPPSLMSAEDYFEALMWSAIGSHPPGFSDGYYGHWRNPADSGS